MGTTMSTTTAEEHNSVNNSAEVRPLLNVSPSESINRQRGVLSFRSALGNFYSQQNQKIAVGGLVLCDFFRCMAIRTLATWIPFIWVLYDPIFAQPGVPKPDMVTKRFESMHIAYLVIVNLGTVISGVVSDAWLRKTRMLLCATVLSWIGFGYISGVMFELPHNFNCTIIHQNNSGGEYLYCSIDPLKAMGKDLDGMALVYLIVVCIISGAQSTLGSIIPALAGDQMTSKDEVRKLYAWYYWIWKLGDTVSAVFCAAVTLNFNYTGPSQLLESIKQKFTFMALSFAIFVDVSATLSILIMLVVICMKKIREYRPDVSVIVDTAGIWRQAWKRRKNRKEDEGFLSTALFRNGGDYPEGSVKERADLGKFFCVLVCLIPTSYSTGLPSTMIDATDRLMRPYSASDIYLSTIHDKLLGSVTSQGTGLVFIPIIYAVTKIINSRTRFRISLLHRIVAGQLCSIASCVVTVTTKGPLCSPIVTGVFHGISRAFIFIAGYELTILSAPRSMQATAMGMFYSIDGFTALVNLAVTYIPWTTFTAEYYYAGIGLNVISIVVLVVMDRNIGLGLNEN